MTFYNKLILSIVGIFLAIIILLPLIKAYGTQENLTVYVSSKERIVESNGESTSSKYLVFTEKEVFENSDSFLLWKFNSSDLHSKLKKGSTYNVKVVGWRIPFLSSYRNIIKINES
ncbi:MAG: DUF1523 family protein [Cyanothece sp. SIO1E1]|nr:DUF1523 family protein [Cyanothece sp. SIO1E1]